MLNIHLNGDIVRCPDISAIQTRLKETREHEGRCIYNISRLHCYAWIDHCKDLPGVKTISSYGNCILSRCDVCPMHKKQVETGKIKKSYKVNTVNYRKMASAAHDLVKSSYYKTLFLTLTFPKFKFKADEKQINSCFSKFVENLRKNYGCMGYVAVREYGKIGNRVHFHILCSLPYTNFITLNAAWCHSISDICEFSPNAVRTTKETLFIKNPRRALMYVCKYFAKAKHQTSETKLIFMSNNLIKTPIKKQSDLNIILKGYKGIYINQSSDYTTVFRVTDPVSFSKFCNEFLYDAFNDYYKYPLFKNKCSDFYSPGYG